MIGKALAIINRIEMSNMKKKIAMVRTDSKKPYNIADDIYKRMHIASVEDIFNDRKIKIVSFVTKSKSRRIVSGLEIKKSLMTLSII